MVDMAEPSRKLSPHMTQQHISEHASWKWTNVSDSLGSKKNYLLVSENSETSSIIFYHTEILQQIITSG